MTDVTPVNFIEKGKRKGTEMYAGVRGGGTHDGLTVRPTSYKTTSRTRLSPSLPPVSPSTLVSLWAHFPRGPEAGAASTACRGVGVRPAAAAANSSLASQGPGVGQTAGPGPATNDEQFSKRVDDRNEEILTKQNTGIKTWKI